MPKFRRGDRVVRINTNIDSVIMVGDLGVITTADYHANVIFDKTEFKSTGSYAKNLKLYDPNSEDSDE